VRHNDDDKFNQFQRRRPSFERRNQSFTVNGPVTGSIAPGATVNGFGLSINNGQSGANGAITFNNSGTVRSDDPGAAGFPALSLQSFSGGPSNLTTSGTVQGGILVVSGGSGSARIDVTGGTVTLANSSNATVVGVAQGIGSAQINISGGNISGSTGINVSAVSGVAGVNVSSGSISAAGGGNSGISAFGQTGGVTINLTGGSITASDSAGGIFASASGGPISITIGPTRP
jgi:fibronectin-binding autotransporter adhesin